MTCDDIREHLHEAHDDDPAAALAEPVRAHLAGCGPCREFNDDLDALSHALRALPCVPLPADALDNVWRKTLDAGPGLSTTALGFWRLAAAAVVVTALSVTTLYFVFAPSRPPEPSAVELARASAQAEIVFGYTARALAATRDVATDRILASKIAPAVRDAAPAHRSRRP